MMSLIPSELITPTDAAELLCVDPKTVSRWASAGKIHSVRTPGGHRRFVRSEIRAIVARDQAPAGPQPTNLDMAPAPQPPIEFEPARVDTSERTRAAAVVADAVALAATLQAEHAATDVARASAAAHRAAQLTAAAATRLREARLQAADQAAEALASDAAEMAAQVKLRADTSARLLSQAAADAAALVVSTRQLDRDPEAAPKARQLATTVHEAAMMVAQENVEAAAQVARDVAAAAAVVASAVAAADTAIEREVAQLAATVQAMATAEARTTAAETADRASAVAVVARDAARGVRRRAIDRGQPGPTAPTTEPTDAMLTSAPARQPTLYAVAARNR